ncbi:hypothetical protein [Pedobacter sp. SYSU D00535]|uniref:hypothetical protein n=1 Tax=Pedobacter sp. SYSU D00535 TaxID=2810308 RepID=UPI001A97586F|nr:hypothetical protein [Pedobacter sp. SYSU D00535]
MKDFIRTPKSEKLIQDFALKVGGILYIPVDSEEVPEQPGALRRYNGNWEGWDGTEWESLGGISPEDLGPGLTVVDDKVTLDTETLALVSPTIYPEWTIYRNDGLTPYATPYTTAKHITVDKGCKVDLSAIFNYPVPGAGQGAPTGMSGNFPGSLPSPGNNSSVLAVAGIVANASYSVTLSKPKSGLMVVGSSVKPATGNDTTSDSISVNFQGRGVLAYFPDAALSAAQIESVLNGASFQTSRSRTFSGVTASGGNYTYYIYDASLGNITNAIQNGALPVLGAFQFLSQVTITNAAGFQMPVIVVRSNATDAFNNVTLAFS